MRYWIRKAPNDKGWFARHESTYTPDEPMSRSDPYGYTRTYEWEEIPEPLRERLAVLQIAGLYTPIPGVGTAFSDNFFICGCEDITL
jgi:hypothetical protein